MRTSEINQEVWDKLIIEEEEGRKKARLPIEPMHRGRRMPYVLFGAIEGRGQPDEKPSLFRLNLAAGHAQVAMIRMYALDKGFKILKWWMPTSKQYKEANEAASAGKSAVYEDVTGGLWEQLDYACRELTGNDRIIESKDAAIAALEAKVKEYERKGKS